MNELERKRFYAEATDLLDRAKFLLEEAYKDHLKTAQAKERKAA